MQDTERKKQNDVRTVMMREKKKFVDSVIRPAKDYRSTNRLNHFLSNNYIIPVEIILLDLFFFSLFNYIVNSCTNLFQLFVYGKDTNIEECMNIKNMMVDFSLIRTSKTVAYVYIAFLIVILIMDVMFIYNIKTSLSEDHFNVKQKGDRRLALLEEIKKQYIEIPDRDKQFTGQGGTIVSRYKDSFYIDPQITNNLIIGMTRSGKGENFVFPSIDVYSRAEIQSSFVIFDPKLELYKSSVKTLEERGYKVVLLNLIDPEYSAGYNPLSLITKYYKSKNIGKAELLSDSFAYSIFSPDKEEVGGVNKFFDQTAAGVLSAMILALVEDCLKEDEILNEKRWSTYKKKTESYTKYIGINPDMKEQIIEAYQKEESRCKKNNEDIFLDKNIQYIPSDVKFYYVDEFEKCINMYSINVIITELCQKNIVGTDSTALDEYFRRRPPMNAAKMKYVSALVAGEKTKGSILSNTTNGIRIFNNHEIAKMTAESSVDIKEIGFGKQPVAVFMGIPDWDRSNHFLATVFVRQVYFHLSEECQHKGKCIRPVKFICDEFGNMPRFDDMKNMITVCLGRNISFDMFIQDLSQLDEVYGKSAKTIKANCGYTVYIKSNDETTIEEISKAVGDKTITNLTRNGKKLSLNKTFTESNDQQRILPPARLMDLFRGENVILRTMKTTDLKNNDIRPYPIFNCKEFGTRFLYRYQYLTETFPNPDEIDIRDINRESRIHIEPKKRIWDVELSFMHYEEYDNGKLQKILCVKDLKEWEKIKLLEILLEKMGEDLENYKIAKKHNNLYAKNEQDNWNMNEEMAISRLIDIINNYSRFSSIERTALMSVLKGKVEYDNSNQ